MSELVPNEIIEKLEERHERLIVELDELNDRLEKALNSFVRSPNENGPSEESGEIRVTKDERVTKSEV